MPLSLQARGQEQYEQIDDSHMVDMLARIDFQAHDFDREVLDGKNLGDIYATLELDSLEEHVEHLGEGLGQVLDALDFEGDSGNLEDFSLSTLNTLDDTEVRNLDPEHLVDLANTVGGNNIIDLDAEQIEIIVDNLEADTLTEFDPTVVGGMFAGLVDEQIVALEEETIAVALEAAGADLLGGLGDFNDIPGGATSFDLKADAADLAVALEQDGSGELQEEAVNFFSGSLFGGDDDDN